MSYTRFVATLSLFVLAAVLLIPSSEPAQAQLCPPGYKIIGGKCRKQPPPPPTRRSPTPRPTPYSFSVNLPNGTRLEMVQLPGGEFTMGSDRYEVDEMPKHSVRVSPFAIGKYEVSQAQWSAVMGSVNPSHFKGDNLPVEEITWAEAIEFCQRLSARNGDQFRLPTEAEWEYAARAGSATEYSFGDEEKLLDSYGWHNDNSGGKTHVVGSRIPNRWNLFDMHGNVYEWCQDWFSDCYYQELFINSVVSNPQGPATGVSRVIRGGGYNNEKGRCRSAERLGWKTDARDSGTGFRIVRNGR